MLVKADIHIHTCLSPCGDILQSPKRVVEKAYEQGLTMIFITDHNTVENTEAAIKAAEKYNEFNVYPGIEITSIEEVHTLGLFENINDAGKVQEYIYKYLSDTENEKEIKNQILANENDEVEGYLEKSLITSVNLSVNKLLNLIQQNNGIAIAAHIDRESFSIISQLGFIPDNLKYDGLEITPNMSIKEALEKYPEYSTKYRFLKGSDSHSLNLIGTAYTEYEAADNSFKNFKNYLYERPFTSYS